MSLSGELHRGKKWVELYTRSDGTLADDVANDPNKMADVNKYNEWLKEQPPKPVKQTKSTSTKEKK